MSDGDDVTAATRCDGIDIYGDNNEPDWNAFTEKGFRFAFHKTGQQFRNGLSPDTSFQPRHRRTRAAGVICGSFHFYGYVGGAHRNGNTGADQADAVVAQVVRLLPGDLAPSLDFESGLIKEGPAPSAAGWRDELGGFLDGIETKLGRTPIIYTRENLWSSTIESSAGYREADFRYFQIYPLWEIHYSNQNQTVNGEVIQISEETFQDHMGEAKWQTAAGMLGDWRYANRASAHPSAGTVPPPWDKTGTKWAFLQYSGITPGQFVRGGSKSLGFDRLTDCDVTRGGIHFLEGLADMSRLGVSLIGDMITVVHRDVNGHTHVATKSDNAWSDVDLGGANGVIPDGASDVVLQVQNSMAYAYYRHDGQLVETANTAGFVPLARIPFASAPVHDPRTAANATTRYVVVWGDDDDWHLGRFETATGQWLPIGGLLRAAGVPSGMKATGQPTVYLQDDVVHVVGRVGDEGHLYDVTWNGSKWVYTDLFAGGIGWSADLADVQQAATYSPTVWSIGLETFYGFRAVRGALCMMTKSVGTVTHPGALPSPAVGNPTSMQIDLDPHLITRAVDGGLYDIMSVGNQYRAVKIECGVEIVADPVATSNGTIGVVAARGIDGSVVVARFANGAWTCETAVTGS